MDQGNAVPRINRGPSKSGLIRYISPTDTGTTGTPMNKLVG